MIYPFIQQIFVGYLLRIRWPSRHWNTDDGQSGWHFPFRTDLPLTSPCQPATLPPSLPTVPRLFLLLGTLHFVKSYWLFVQSLSHVQFFVTPWTVAHQASLSFIISWNFLKFMSIEPVMPSNHLILCHPLSPPSLNLAQHQGLFQWVGSSHQVAKILEFQLQYQLFQWIFRVDFL